MLKLLGLGEKIQVTYRSYSSFSDMAEDLHKGELDVIFPVFSDMWWRSSTAWQVRRM